TEALHSLFSTMPFFLMLRRARRPTLFPYTTLFRSAWADRNRQDPRIRRVLTRASGGFACRWRTRNDSRSDRRHRRSGAIGPDDRSEEHTSELQSREKLVCRLLLEKKKEKPLQLLKY